MRFAFGEAAVQIISLILGNGSACDGIRRGIQSLGHDNVFTIL